jgi:NADP-dependent 3-hydroxy acid dehydrogenase YdfG
MFAAAARLVPLAGKTAMITGASSGIGKATACALATAGCNLILVARREEKLQEIATAVQERGLPVTVDIAAGDVCSEELYTMLEERGYLSQVDFLINNAGLAKGKEQAHEARLEDWETMMNANCMGAFRMIRTVLPGMIERGSGHIISTGSIAGLEAYEGGTVYCASKHALHAFMKVLRYETYDKNVRTTIVAPGFVGAGTEFAQTRFAGEADMADKANATYVGYQELSAADVAASIIFALQQPAHVNLDMVHIMPSAQGGATRIHRVTQ